MLRIAADPKHLGARIGILSVLHSWGSALTHHPHVHMIVPGGGFSLDGKRWVSCRPLFLLAVEVLSALFRGLFLDKLRAAHRAGALAFFGKHARLADPRAFAAYLAPLWNTKWVVYCKHPFGGPKEVLRYLARYTSDPCGTAQALPLDAISCLGAFRTPVGGARGEISAASVRKPAHSRCEQVQQTEQVIASVKCNAPLLHRLDRV